MGDDLFEAVRDLPKVTKYLHVPAQSGCDDVLRRMKRMYTVGEYREMTARARATIPDVSISSDFIVGFCGETEESFQRSCDLVREARFKNSYIFKYSTRPGTKADDLYADDIPEDVKKRRNNDLLAAQNAESLKIHRALIGRTFEVLVEGPSKKAFTDESGSGPIQLTGRTNTDHIVVFGGNERLTGTFADVFILEASAFTLFGSVETSEHTDTASLTPPNVARTPEFNRRIGLPVI
jgi:tRNA-2-methylthio-N6-dimethylallyladenosine synthase